MDQDPGIESAMLEMSRPSEAGGNDRPYRRVLVPLDGSAPAEAVLPHALRLARPLGMELVLVRVVPPLSTRIPEGGRYIAIEAIERVQHEAEQYLREVADRWGAGGLRFLTSVRAGDAADEIIAAVRDSGADLIAMTTHGRSGLGRLLFGSVAQAVVKRADVPVLLLRLGAAAAARRAA